MLNRNNNIPGSNSFANINVPVVLQQSYLPSLDGLRALSILLVITAHISQRFLYKENDIAALTKLGDLGVHFFFVISGFLITTLLLKERIENGAVSLRNFYIKRFLRILPLAYLYIAIILLLAYTFHVDIIHKQVAGSLLFIYNMPYYRIGGDGVLGHFWSLAVEEQFYILFPALLFKSREFKVHPVVRFVLIILIVLLSRILFKDMLDFYSPYISIIFGCLLSYLIMIKFKNINWLISNKQLINSVAFVGIFYLTMSSFRLFNDVRLSGFVVSIVIDIAICLIIITNIRANKDVFYKILNNKLFKLIGIYSYSLYIWQQIFTKFILWNGMFKYSGTIVLNLSLLIVVVYISYNFFENPVRNLKNKFLKPIAIKI